jgi:hypothetical protein
VVVACACLVAACDVRRAVAELAGEEGEPVSAPPAPQRVARPQVEEMPHARVIDESEPTGGCILRPDDRPPSPPQRAAVARIDPPRIVAGTRSVEEVSRVVRGRSGVFRACYQKQLGRKPELAGSLEARVSVGRDGRVTSAAMLRARAATLKDEQVVQCVERNLSNLRFSPADSAARFEVRFTYTSEPPKPR